MQISKYMHTHIKNLGLYIKAFDSQILLDNTEMDKARCKPQ